MVVLIHMFIVKLPMLLSIWIPSYVISFKFQATTVCFLIYLVNCDIVKPGHSGYVYKVLDSMQWEKRELLLTGIELTLAIIFEIFLFNKQMWIPVILGVFSIVVRIICFVSAIKDIMKV